LFGKRTPLVGPLFRGYLFARFCPSLSLEAVRRTQGVLRILGSSLSPIPVAAEIIEEIRSRVATDGFIKLDPPAFRPGQRVSIEHGPFEGLMAHVEQEWMTAGASRFY
jgi:transcription antitermination factor NusG